jgi:hypothetical protein
MQILRFRQHELKIEHLVGSAVTESHRLENTDANFMEGSNIQRDWLFIEWRRIYRLPLTSLATSSP